MFNFSTIKIFSLISLKHFHGGEIFFNNSYIINTYHDMRVYFLPA
jgi:hypothetical protein